MIAHISMFIIGIAGGFFGYWINYLITKLIIKLSSEKPNLYENHIISIHNSHSIHSIIGTGEPIIFSGNFCTREYNDGSIKIVCSEN